MVELGILEKNVQFGGDDRWKWGWVKWKKNENVLYCIAA
jgi:hypothetical protein